MRKRIGSMAVACGGILLLAARPADACGGCFVAPSENTVVTGHRMAMSISPVQSVLWDQIQYSGAPEEFSWVLPVKKGARIELANDAWFEVLDAATSTVMQAPFRNCGAPQASVGFWGCGASEAVALGASPRDGGSGVVVVHEGTVGPYETVTLSADAPDALAQWLSDHGYSLPAEVKPVVDAYVQEDFDFIALRLIPGVGVQAMRPVRVLTPGAVLALPLRMVAAGTGAETAIQLFVIGEGRYAAQNFPNGSVDPDELVWNFNTGASNYAALRTAALTQNDGRTFLSTYARAGSLVGAVSDDLGPVFYTVQTPDLSYSRTATTIGEAYFYQGDANGDKTGNVNACVDALNVTVNDALGSGKRVADDCTTGGTCTEVGADEVKKSRFVCGELDDLGVALVGLHPSDVWLTRLEANLPRAALGTDLGLEAAAQQDPMAHRHAVVRSVNDPCASAGTTIGPTSRPRTPVVPGSIGAGALGLAALAWAMRRRTQNATA